MGDEVIIAYMDNDIDKPFISGSLYNTTNTIPSTLPKQDHITTLSSKTIGAQEYGYNQLCFSNLKDNFGIFNILYKKLEQKSNEKVAKELAIEGVTGYVVTKSIETGFVIKQAVKQTGKKDKSWS